jgi:hypothetical protein
VLKRIVRVLALGLLSVPMLLMATGCHEYEKLNGGGWMLSANGEDRATFGIHVNATHSDARRGARGTYHDHGTGLRLKFYRLVSAGQSLEDDCAVFKATYTSQDKRQPGKGTVGVVACDNGEPGAKGDTLEISVTNGPYAGYYNAGPILGGNFQYFPLEEQ